MTEFLKSLNPKTRLLLALLLGATVIFCFVLTLSGFLAVREKAGEDDLADRTSVLAREMDTQFQLAISEAKNFVILKDDLNKDRALGYFKKAQENFNQLSQQEKDPEGQKLLYRLGAGLQSVNFQLGILTSTAKKSDPAGKLYTRYLKDITLDFDDASHVYLDHLDRKVQVEGSELNRKIQWDLFFALAGAFLGLVGMGLSYSIARNLNQALRNETASQERYRMLTEVTEEAIMIHDQGIIVDANPTLARLLGYPLSEVLGKHVSLFMDKASAEVTRERLQKGYPERSYEIQARRKDGSIFPLSVRGSDIEYRGRKMRLSCGWDMTEWKKAETALRESQERFERFAEVTREGIMIHEKGVIVDVNQSLLEMTGMAASDLVGTDGMAVLSGESAQKVRGFRKYGYPTEPYEITLRHKDGRLIPLEVHGRPFHFQGRELRVARFWDLTERKKIEEALRKSEEWFRTMLENSHEGITLVGADGKVLYVSPSNEKLTGYQPKERLGQGILEIVDPDDLPRAKGMLGDLFKNPGKSVTAQLRIRHKSGEWRIAEFTAANLLHNPDVGGILINARDITEKEKAKEALEQKERYFQAIIEKSYEAFVLIGQDSLIRYVSPAMEAIYGWSPAERLGRSSLELLHPDDLARARELFGALLKRPGGTESGQGRFRHKDGHYLTIDIRATNLIEDPDVGGIVVNYRDVTEKVRAEEALRKSEEHFRSLIENSHDVISVTGKDGLMNYISPSVRRVLGYEPAERLGKGYVHIMHSDDLERIKSEFSKLLSAEGASWTVEFRLRHKDGSWRHVESTGINLLGNPSVQGIIYNLRDITEKVKAEEAMRQSEENFRNLIQKSPDAILVQQEGKISFINARLLALLDYDEKEDLLGKSWGEIVHPEDHRTIVQRIQTLSQGGRTYPMEIRLIRRDGAMVPVETASIGIQFEGVPSVMVSLRDITSRKQAEEAARENQERYRSLVDSMPDAVLVHDEEKVIYMNPSALVMFGARSQEDFQDKPYWVMIPPELREAVQERVRATIEKGTINPPVERKLLRLDGTFLEALTTSVPFLAGGRRVVLAILSDITARKEAERKAQKFQRLAALGELAAGLAHEIRNPAAAISAQAQYLLKKTEPGTPAYDQLKDIIAQCDRLDTLVHDTLDYSPEKKFEERTEIPAKDLLQKTLWLAQTQFGPSHARVQVILDVQPDLPLLKVHPTRMERVLVNLILNAFQAMPDGGHLLLKAKRQENKAILRIEDDGKGISDQEMSRLFEPFFTSRKMGSGLGLSICQKIVEEHGGQIQVERLEPHGAAFNIEIPLQS